MIDLPAYQKQNETGSKEITSQEKRHHHQDKAFIIMLTALMVYFVVSGIGVFIWGILDPDIGVGAIFNLSRIFTGIYIIARIIGELVAEDDRRLQEYSNRSNEA